MWAAALCSDDGKRHETREPLLKLPLNPTEHVFVKLPLNLSVSAADSLFNPAPSRPRTEETFWHPPGWAQGTGKREGSSESEGEREGWSAGGEGGRQPGYRFTRDHKPQQVPLPQRTTLIHTEATARKCTHTKVGQCYKHMENMNSLQKWPKLDENNLFFFFFFFVKAVRHLCWPVGMIHMFLPLFSTLLLSDHLVSPYFSTRGCCKHRLSEGGADRDISLPLWEFSQRWICYFCLEDDPVFEKWNDEVIWSWATVINLWKGLERSWSQIRQQRLYLWRAFVFLPCFILSLLPHLFIIQDLVSLTFCPPFYPSFIHVSVSPVYPLQGSRQLLVRFHFQSSASSSTSCSRP